ncbi:hypothetical protein [Psychrobacillus lasiicapitis]|uniref:hypothetical protein n=1 Tax=Psychrobacillus lasiicapitis TaxID=1636719 RepID=UPI0019CBEAEB|nr:hypothetical protein [Psychrobacillus lasiicapitis]GGA41238.1 hypothetical protein GCM10011384_33650 [Psychrobacillus lasiicapitis]
MKPGTIQVHLLEINKLLPYFAQLKLKDITRKGYQDALNQLKERGYSDSTREGIHRTGRMIFRKASELKDPTEFAYLKSDCYQNGITENARLLTMENLNIELTPHSLQHTHTSLEQIMDRLGHLDNQITKKIYLHFTKEMKKEASQKFSQLMRSL